MQPERPQPQRVETFRIGDGHVVGGADAGARQVGTGAPPQVGRTGAHAARDHVQQAQAAQLAQQIEGVAAPDDDDRGAFQRGHRVFGAMQALDGQAGVGQRRHDQRGVVIPVARDAGERHEHGRRALRQGFDQLTDVRHSVDQVAGVAAGIAE
ncbi:hypothetical protein G6F68_018567 [Rhizopus microsporus]|nr:hypothetical protein G6F68_018567 [Rhizopus microsporus]